MKRLVCLLLVLLPLGASAQARLDSLRQRLAASRPDTSRVLLLNLLCWENATRDARSAQAYGRQGLALARELHFRLGEVYVLNSLALAAYVQHDEPAASRSYQQAIRVAETEPRAGRLLSLALLGLGRIANQQRDFAEGEKYFRQALARMQQQKPASASDIGMVQNHLSMLYYEWQRSGLPAPDSVGRLSLRYAGHALATFRRLPPDAKLASCFSDVALVYAQHQRYDSAEYYHRAAQRLYERFGERFGQTQNQLSLADVLLARHRPAEAVQLLRPALAWAHQLHLSGLEAQARQSLATALAATGQGLEAYQQTRAGQALLDSIQATERRQDLTRLRVQFDSERQQSRVLALTQRTQLQRRYLWWLGGLLLAVAAGLLAAGVLGWRLRRSRALLARQNEELTTTRAEQDRLYALIAHDLRSPVVAFTGLADLLTSYVERHDTARLLRLGGRMRQAAEGLRGLLDNLLSWALAQRGELTPHPEPLAAADLLAEAAGLYQPSAEAAGVQLVVAPEASGHLLADRNMTRTVLRNLISNALRATPAGGRIELATAPAAGGGLSLLVRDTGEGMTATQLQRVSGGAPITSGRSGAAGLGLRLSQAFARVQGGRLALHSQPGEGTTAVLTLPAAAAGPAALAVPDAATPHAAVA
ncbi:HAMP domain-containing histidine kinase [Microvirga sp. STS02]|uniref:sensor histidine kinase n=1 Tax=Hymenobacter negativus TaxID=2795026 RepID=UPI0018DD2EA4|nr:MULTISPECIES: HAMP domain-containing sensor histidine kinase [Bacteria]MBH8569044.1 HAMP domain-containing histidine kinase [Hymenobacter negativus]MBR7208779.1 HAMP domain-containing histidine kinase [Microvirga sp. STS02]